MSRKHISFLVIIIVLVMLSILHAIGTPGFQLTASPFDSEQQYRVVPVLPLTLVTMPDDATATVLTQIQQASNSIDLVIYELSDPTIEKALIDKHDHGVMVRVLLNPGYNGAQTMNKVAFKALTDAGLSVRYTPASFALTHQKTLVTDHASALIMTYNLVPKYYATGRDFGIIDSNPNDVEDIERTFDADWNSQKIDPQIGDTLVWSPGSKDVMLGLIASATSTLEVYNEEMQDPDIIAALDSAASHGVTTSVVMTDASQWHDAFADLISHGVKVYTYSSKARLYIHAKVIIADNHEAFLGSENFSTNSLSRNRELGVLIATPSILQSLESTFTTDMQSATPYTQ